MGATTVEIPASHVAMVSHPDPAAHSALLRATARCLRASPDRISFIKVLKHVRRSVIRQSAQTSVQIKQLMVIMAAKVRRKLDNGRGLGPAAGPVRLDGLETLGAFCRWNRY